MAATARRTDIHRPSAPEFDPEKYRCVGVFYFGSDEGAALRAAGNWQAYEAATKRLTADGWTRGGSQAGACGHCGAYLMYAALMLHDESHEWMLVGEQCLGNRFSGTKADFAALRRQVADDRRTFAEWRRFVAYCEEHPSVAYASYAANIAMAVLDSGETFSEATHKSWALSTLGDIARKAGRYDLSEKQLAFMERLFAEIEQAAVDLAEASPKPEVPAIEAGRYEITGEIAHTKWQDNNFGGGAVKMLVIAENGQRFWGTLPRSLPDDLEPKGRTVRLTATVQPSDDDTAFAFFARPAKASYVD